MSAVPSAAMPRAYANDDEESEQLGDAAPLSLPSAGKLIAGAIAAYLLYRLLA